METKQPTKEEVIDWLNALPQEIVQAENEILKISEDIPKLQEEVDNGWNKTYAAVCEEQEDIEVNGAVKVRPKYSNDSLRKAETELRMSNSPRYSGIMMEIKNKKRELASKQIILDFKKRTFSAKKATAYLLGGNDGRTM